MDLVLGSSYPLFGVMSSGGFGGRNRKGRGASGFLPSILAEVDLFIMTVAMKLNMSMLKTPFQNWKRPGAPTV